MDRLAVTDSSHVAAARRHVVGLAANAGQNEPDTARAALIVTELANNLLRHGGGGELLVGLDRATEAGIEVLAIDSGKGMSDIAACLQDGYSTGGTPGTGMGAVKRMADQMDVYSRPKSGTTVLARVWRRGDPPPMPRRQLGIVTVPKTGETVCGDGATAVLENDGRVGLLMADGLGHGELAAAASQEALRNFRGRPLADPVTVLETLHERLRHTRGAAIAVAIVNNSNHVVNYGGVGNIAGLLVDGGGVKRMVSYNGTVGHGLWKVQSFDYPTSDAPVVVMHSDGLTTSWSLDSHPGLLAHDPVVIAATLYRSHARGRDDCGVLVWKG
jgi:anti-sigma regulatory factor (Ser/Thr protein kinase)